MTLAEVFAAFLGSRRDGPLMIHTDVFKARDLIDKSRHPRVVVERHLQVIDDAAAGRPRWFAAFNYDFLGSGHYDPREAPCQVGALGEAQRTQDGAWRSNSPVFSFVGPADSVAPTDVDLTSFREFDATSAFGQLVAKRGSLCFYGAGFASCTFIHHAELCYGMQHGAVPYRYDKVFRGTVAHHEASGPSRSPIEVEYIYHVRPMGHALDYDWPRLENDLVDAGLLNQLRSGALTVAQSIDAAALLEFWLDKLSADPLYLLDAASKDWVAPKLDALGRPFQLTDFEGDAA